MRLKGLTRRWMFNILGMVVAVLITIILSLSFAVQNYVYNGILQVLNGSSSELANIFSDYRDQSPSDFLAFARGYVEESANKEAMEMMVIDSTGQIIVTSSGFAPDETLPMDDYEAALGNESGYGTWTGKLTSGEKVMSVTRVIRNDEGEVLGAIRYMVSLTEADAQVFTIAAILTSIGVFLLLFIIFSSMYFVRSIVSPLKQISSTAQKIAQGDFNARIEKVRNDEIGELCDTINDMAVELGVAEKMKNDFISSVSHELRTPLTAIKGWAETMQMQGGEIDRQTFDRGMGVIIRESERLSGIVEELLDFSRMQSGRMSLMMDRIDILAELGEAVYMFSDRATAEHKFLLYEEPAMLSPVLGDINRLRQVFVNIIDNALKYTEEGGTVNVSAVESEGYIRVIIADNGCGIPPDHLPNVKKKFYKANQTIRGSGIGLALANEIMTLHAGSLEIESQENVGTAVTIIIPTLKELEAQKQEESALEPSTAALPEKDGIEERNTENHG